MSPYDTPITETVFKLIVITSSGGVKARYGWKIQYDNISIETWSGKNGQVFLCKEDALSDFKIFADVQHIKWSLYG